MVLAYRPDARQAGVTLVEMVIVVAVLAVAASLAIPKADSISPAVADAAAGEVARALRFAQREAIRNDKYYRVEFNTATQKLRVYPMMTWGVVMEDWGTTVRHPVNKNTYEVNFSANPTMRSTIVSAVFKYDGTTRSYASFGPDGTPADIHGWAAKDVDPLGENGTITIRHGNAERVVSVAPVTGRVSVSP